jgi:hypothetical protein
MYGTKTDKMNFENIQIIVISLVSVANILLLVWQTRKRVPAEIDKMHGEQVESLSEAAESNMAGAKISNDLLVQRVRELKKDLRDAWNYIAILKRQIVEAGLIPPNYTPTESDPNIPKVQ